MLVEGSAMDAAKPIAVPQPATEAQPAVQSEAQPARQGISGCIPRRPFRNRCEKVGCSKWPAGTGGLETSLQPTKGGLQTSRLPSRLYLSDADNDPIFWLPGLSQLKTHILASTDHQDARATAF